MTVSEGPRRELRLGAGAAFDGGVSVDNAQWLLRGRAGYTLRGIIDPLTTFDAELRPGLSLQTNEGGVPEFVGEATLTLSRDDLLVPLMKGVATLGYDISAFDAFTSNGPGLRLGTERPLWNRRIKVGIGWQIDLLCFSDRPGILDPGSDEYDAELAGKLGLDRSCDIFNFPTATSYKLAYFEETIALDMRDSVFDTRSGYYLEARFEQAALITGSEFSYFKITPEARGYLSLGSRVVVAARVRYGRNLFGDLPNHPALLFGRGVEPAGASVNGNLRPLPATSKPVTSKSAAMSSLSQPLKHASTCFGCGGAPLGLAAFVDAGDVADESTSLDPTNLHIAPGIGLRYRTPIGPFRLDVAYRATRRGAGEIHSGDTYAWHLSIGEAF